MFNKNKEGCLFYFWKSVHSVRRKNPSEVSVKGLNNAFKEAILFYALKVPHSA